MALNVVIDYPAVLHMLPSRRPAIWKDNAKPKTLPLTAGIIILDLKFCNFNIDKFYIFALLMIDDYCHKAVLFILCLYLNSQKALSLKDQRLWLQKFHLYPLFFLNAACDYPYMGNNCLN